MLVNECWFDTRAVSSPPRLTTPSPSHGLLFVLTYKSLFYPVYHELDLSKSTLSNSLMLWFCCLTVFTSNISRRAELSIVKGRGDQKRLSFPGPTWYYYILWLAYDNRYSTKVESQMIFSLYNCELFFWRWDEKTKTYRLSGTKSWISNSPVADVVIVWARSDKHDNDIKVCWRF